jgi:4-diphosphocytidyl-2-C-methyl-D-erythritol kinase
MVPVTLYDQIDLSLVDEGISITCEGFPVPSDESNLVYRAAKAFFSITGLSQGLSVKLVKNMPVAAGLGGGSSDAASTLLALNAMCPCRPLSDTDLKGLALGLGADVPFFLHARPCLATGIGEILEPIRNWPEFWYLIVTPRIHVPTGWVYSNLKLELTTNEYAYINTVLQKRCLELDDILENDLESVTARHLPVINHIKKYLLHAGADGALMSGSGPSVFGVFRSEYRALRAKEYLSSQNLGDVFVVTHCDVAI